MRDLFNHRSGLPGTSGDDLEDIGFDRDDHRERLRLVPPSSSFRAGYSYTNAGLTVGALAAARPTGKDWETRRRGAAVRAARHDLDELSPRRFRRRAATPRRCTCAVDGAWAAAVERDADAQAPAGGASASARDLGAMDAGSNSATARSATTPVIDPDALAATHVAADVARRRTRSPAPRSSTGSAGSSSSAGTACTWGHAGAFSAGARTLVTLYPDAGLGIVVLANGFPTGAPEGSPTASPTSCSTAPSRRTT